MTNSNSMSILELVKNNEIKILITKSDINSAKIKEETKTPICNAIKRLAIGDESYCSFFMVTVKKDGVFFKLKPSDFEIYNKFLTDFHTGEHVESIEIKFKITAIKKNTFVFDI